MTAQRDKTHCPKGHEYKGYNLIVDRYEDGTERRRCRTCDRDRSREYQARKRLRELLGGQ